MHEVNPVCLWMWNYCVVTDVVSPVSPAQPAFHPLVQHISIPFIVCCMWGHVVQNDVFLNTRITCFSATWSSFERHVDKSSCEEIKDLHILLPVIPPHTLTERNVGRNHHITRVVIFFFFKVVTTPNVGLELMTRGSRVACFTYWASQAPLKLLFPLQL